MSVPLAEQVIEVINKATFSPTQIAGRKILVFGPPKIGKTILAARLGKCNYIITDEDGYTALMNDSVKQLTGHWRYTKFTGWGDVCIIMQAIEAGQLLCGECGNPYDNLILDTLSGMIAQVVQEITCSKITPERGRLSSETASQPDYLVSRDRLYPVMRQMAQMRNASVTLIMHTRERGKVIPEVVPDAHNSAYEVVNKYISVQAFLTMKDGNRILQVRPTGNNVVVGSRYDFPDNFVTDDDFVKHIQKWKETT